MGVFKDEAEAREVFDTMFERILAIEESNKQFSATNAVLGVYYPDDGWTYTVNIDGTQSPTVLNHDPDAKVDIEIRMSTDTAHTFWKGDLNFPVAMMKGKVKIKGPSATVMKLLPAVAPGHEIYPAILKERGREDALA
ncbi:MAG: SCP2 sterol-binding domain-containing protein [Actinomycetota bacterium]